MSNIVVMAPELIKLVCHVSFWPKLIICPTFQNASVAKAAPGWCTAATHRRRPSAQRADCALAALRPLHA